MSLVRPRHRERNVIRGGKYGAVDGAHEQCRLDFRTEVAPMMRHCGPFGFGGMMEPWRPHFS